jgi:co-chaperonin GroES (HSP10)
MLRPLHTDVIVELIPDARYKGLIIIPENAKFKKNYGVVKAVGADVKDIAVNDFVAFGSFTQPLSEKAWIHIDSNLCEAVVDEAETKSC